MMANKRRSVARRPDLSKPVLSHEELQHLRYTLSKVSVGTVQQTYREAHANCLMRGDQPPKAKHVQELVQAWRELNKRKKSNQQL
jgi:hypothetical protein